MQKRRFLKRILAIFFLSTTVAAVQPPVLHAVPGQDLAMQFGRRTALNLYSEWCWGAMWRLASFAMNQNDPIEDLPWAIFRILVPANPRQAVGRAVAQAGHDTLELPMLNYFTQNNRLRYVDTYGHRLGWFNGPIFLAGYLHKLKARTFSTDQTPAANLLAHQARDISHVAILFGAMLYLRRHFSGTWDNAFSRLVLQRTMYPPAPQPPEERCVICFEDEGDFVAPCPNGHMFHEECLRGWTNVQNNCPTCRNKELISVRQPLMSRETLRAFFQNESVRNAFSKTARVYGPIAAGLLIGLFAHRRGIGELDEINKMWKKS